MRLTRVRSQRFALPSRGFTNARQRALWASQPRPAGCAGPESLGAGWRTSACAGSGSDRLSPEDASGPSCPRGGAPPDQRDPRHRWTTSHRHDRQGRAGIGRCPRVAWARAARNDTFHCLCVSPEPERAAKPVRMTAFMFSALDGSLSGCHACNDAGQARATIAFVSCGLDAGLSERRRSRAPSGAVNVRDEATGAIVRIVDHGYFPLVVRVMSPPTTGRGLQHLMRAT